MLLTRTEKEGQCEGIVRMRVEILAGLSDNIVP